MAAVGKDSLPYLVDETFLPLLVGCVIMKVVVVPYFIPLPRIHLFYIHLEPLNPHVKCATSWDHTALQCYNRFNHAYHGKNIKSQLVVFVVGFPSSVDYNGYPHIEATNHLRPLNLQSKEYACTGQIRVGNSVCLDITHIGSSFLPSFSKLFVLHDVLHVPQIIKNLISVSQFEKDNDGFLNFIQIFLMLRIKLRDASSISGRENLDSTLFFS